MKELIKPNSKEEQYSEIEGYCERNEGYSQRYCGEITCSERGDCPTVTCNGEYTTQDASLDILF